MARLRYSRSALARCYSPRWRYHMDPMLLVSPWRFRTGRRKR